MTKLLFGIGINDANYVTAAVRNPYYITWYNILTRCYSESYHKKRPSYIGCIIDERWIYFSKFKSWMEQQDWKDKEIDKDIISPGNKLYSPETCCFIDSSVNKLIHPVNRKVSAYPIGVSASRSGLKYEAACRSHGKLNFLGSYYTVEEAATVYAEHKASYVREIADKQPDLRIKKGLYLHANLIELGQTL